MLEIEGVKCEIFFFFFWLYLPDVNYILLWIDLSQTYICWFYLIWMVFTPFASGNYWLLFYCVKKKLPYSSVEALKAYSSACPGDGLVSGDHVQEKE